MKRRHLAILLILLIISFTSNAQTYDSQYEICSDSLRKFTQIAQHNIPWPDSLVSVWFQLIKAKDSCLIGVSAPDFHANTLDNKKIEFASLKGQVILLNFWFTSCPGCISEIPGFNKLVKHYTGKKVTCISITYDSSAVVKKFLKQHPFKFITVADNSELRMDTFKLSSIWPYTVIINKEGKIAFIDYASKGEETFSYYKTIIDKLL